MSCIVYEPDETVCLGWINTDKNSKGATIGPLVPSISELPAIPATGATVARSLREL